MKIRVFSPAYNVANTITLLIEELGDVREILKKRGHTFEVLILNDNSTDGTREILNEARKKNTWLKTQHNEKNLGNAGNIIAGYRWGVDSDVDIVGCLDADGEHSPYAMIRHLRMIERGMCDGIAGSIIFPDHHIDRKAIEKTLLEINSLGPQGNGELVKKAINIVTQISQEIIACDDHNDRNMMRFWGRMQSTIAGVDGVFYIQSPGYNLHQRHRVAKALDLFDQYKKYFSEISPETFPKWGLHGVMIHLITVGTGAHTKAVYLECFGKSPNRTPEKLLLQANAANLHTGAVSKFIPGK